jgi:uncharacterized protein (TIGR02444 family)
MPEDLWKFALDLYARPGVETACLAAQTAGANVCLLLCAAWLDSLRSPWSRARQAQLQALADEHEQTFIAPLRALRMAWRAAAGHDPATARLREGVKQLELDAERMLCARLEACCRGWLDEAARASAPAWLEQLEHAAALRQLLEGPAPD